MQYPLFLSHFNKTWIFWTGLQKSSNITLQENLSSGRRVVPHRHMDGQTDTTEQIVTFCNFKNMLKSGHSMTPTTHLHLVPQLRVCAALPQFLKQLHSMVLNHRQNCAFHFITSRLFYLTTVTSRFQSAHLPYKILMCYEQCVCHVTCVCEGLVHISSTFFDMVCKSLTLTAIY
jgi:hypothetical protein